jgi:streptogramin lyase
VARAARADFQLVAKWGSRGTATGQFEIPEGIVVDSSGSVYVADQNNNRIQKFTSDGTFVLAFTGPPNPDPNHFSGPSHLALDSQGNVLVSNEGGYRIEKFSPSGTYLATYGDIATFRENPRGVAADSAGNVYVVLSNAKQVDKFAPGGGLLSSWSTAVTTHTNVDSPAAIAVSAAGIVYVNDLNNGMIDEFTTDGRFLKEWSTQAFPPTLVGTPNALALDSRGNVVVGDARQGAIETFSADGVFISSTRSTGETPGDFQPQGVAAGPGDDVFVTDLRQSRVLRFSQSAAPPVLAPPVAGRAVDVTVVSGTVRVRLSGTNTFVNLTAAQQIPTGSELDTTRGRIRLTAAAPAGATQTSDFYQGRFVVTQSRSGTQLTTLRLSAPLTCTRRSASVAASAATRRQLWGNGKGSFRTQGKLASASVRGTIWLTQDTCKSTTVRVRRGVVAVFDQVRRKTVLVRAGKSYTARR